MGKLTAKENGFCLSVAEGKRLSDAYRENYDASNMMAKTIWEKSSRIMAKPKISARVAELAEVAQERTMVTIESLSREMDENRARADELEQAFTMQSATMGKAKLHGLLVDRKDHTSSDGTMSPVGDIPPSERLADMLNRIKPSKTIGDDG